MAIFGAQPVPAGVSMRSGVDVWQLLKKGDRIDQGQIGVLDFTDAFAGSAR
jgi:hypothetical protein